MLPLLLLLLDESVASRFAPSKPCCSSGAMLSTFWQRAAARRAAFASLAFTRLASLLACFNFHSSPVLSLSASRGRFGGLFSFLTDPGPATEESVDETCTSTS